MRKIRDVLRLHFELNLKQRQIGRSQNLPHSTVGDYIGRAEHAGIAWPLPEGLSDGQLAQKLFPPTPGNGGRP